MADSVELINDALKLLNTPMVEWRATVDALPTSRRGELEEACNALVEHAARLSGYLDRRYGYGCGDYGHEDGVKKANRLAAKIRKVLGYTRARKDVRF